VTDSRPVNSSAVFGQNNPPARTYRGYTRQSLYLPAPDGTRLAATIYLPKDLPAAARLPTLLIQTRYWREIQLKPPLNWFLRAEMLNPRTRYTLPFFTSYGYALVYVDERGTGASFGVWAYPWEEKTLDDMRAVINWVINQPWSNGRVGAYGVSYLGSTAELCAILGNPAVQAVVPQFNHPDAYADISFPGGLFNQRFIRSWGEFDKYLDQNRLPDAFGLAGKLTLRGVHPVDTDQNGVLLTAAIQDHVRNGSMFHTRFRITFRDEQRPPMPASLDGMSVRRFNHLLADSEVPIFGWGSWLDAGTGEAALRRYNTFANTSRTVIGAWDHGGQFHASPYQRAGLLPDPQLPGQLAEMLHFLDTYLKKDTKLEDTPRFIDYYVLGAETWRRAEFFPPTTMHLERWYLAPDGRLSRDTPNEQQAGDSYTVDFTATTGTQNRWWELGAISRQTVVYRNRQAAGRKLLTYLTPPFDEDIELTGYPVISLYITSSHSDGAFIAYLEDVHPDGTVTYLTEGELRGIHRKISSEPPAYNQPIPYHSFCEADAHPLVPGSPAEITFGLLPIAARINRGHRLRLGLAGCDADTFARVPETGTPTWLVHRSAELLSWIELPIVRPTP
jgi:uncharacterized protein